MAAGGGAAKPIINEMPIALEPAFPIFTPRPIRENPYKQTAHLLFVNTTSFKLIFKITAPLSSINYSIRPPVDYLLPRGCRYITVSISEPPQPKKEHDFTYKVAALAASDGLGMTAAQYWEQNRLDNNGQLRELIYSLQYRQLQEGQFVCVEPEAEAKTPSIQRSFSGATLAGGKLTASEYQNRFRRHTSPFDQQVPTETIPQNSPIYHR
ncbi:unnamed protein product [Gongylonema pulchrum]|uniref:MSP domain-containing protein n=1 Tax=Gongylonema pulchrum TaxID=637853 RepID=A0A183ECC0_9BILA|nr:unnamed protein product [Gongylonema pulchrum]